MGESAVESVRLPAGRFLMGLALLFAAMLVHVSGASAVIAPPKLIDGPGPDGLVLGGVAMAPDGTGGLVYRKTVDGQPHIFASRFDGSSWSPPIRVDGENSYEASEPAIAAGSGGRLLVVWVTPVATLANGELRRGLYSASLGPGAEGFAPPLLVDPNLKTGAGTSPSLAGAAPGKAIVAYRVVTNSFGTAGEFTNAVQLRPGDVAADIRVARLEGDRWSRLGAINRNPAASLRPPSETNGPQVAIGATGRAVVAWQEPEASGVARIWVRRVTGTTLGPIFLASPEKFDGKPVSDEATAFALAVTPTDRARLVSRIDGTPDTPLHGQRLFLTTLGSNASAEGAKATEPESIDGGGSGLGGPIGPPALAVSAGGKEEQLALAFTGTGPVRTIGIDAQGQLLPPRTVDGAPAQPGSPMVTTVDPEGGGVVAYEASDESGSPTVVVRQEFPSGELQRGQLYGPLGGGVSGLRGAGSGQGDALLAFTQGESGQVAIVADRVSAPPAGFGLQVPKKWVRPTRALIRWTPPTSAVGDLTYGLVLDGRLVKSQIRRRRVTPPPALLGSGVSRVRVIATDRLGGEVLSRPRKLKVDGGPPALLVRVRRQRGEVSLRIRDGQSGLAKKTAWVSFGDGSGAHGEAAIKHTYARGGSYAIRVRARDRVGNRLVQTVQVAVR